MTCHQSENQRHQSFEPGTQEFQSSSLQALSLSLGLHGIDDLRRCLSKHPDMNWNDALSLGQIKSKIWLLEQWQLLKRPKAGQTFIVGGWLGVLAWLHWLRGHDLSQRFRSFDIDPACRIPSESLNRSFVKKDWLFKATTWDMMAINYSRFNYSTFSSRGPVDLSEEPDVIINTSCEHIDHFENWFELLPPHKLIILQNNDFFSEPSHVSCVTGLDNFKMRAPLDLIMFEGVLDLGAYRRFMLIGTKSP